MNRKVKHIKMMIKDVQFVRELTPAWNWYCLTTPAWRKQKCKQFLRILPTPNSNSEHRKLGAPLKVNVTEGDGNCLFRAISYEVTLSQIIMDFFVCLHVVYFKNDMYQSEFESRHLHNMNVSDYLITTQMENVWNVGS